MNTKIFSFQGVHGAYSELAGKNIYPDSKSIHCKTFEEMFESVRDKKANIAIVPIENSRAGRVADTQRLIPESQLKITDELPRNPSGKILKKDLRAPYWHDADRAIS